MFKLLIVACMVVGVTPRMPMTAPAPVPTPVVAPMRYSRVGNVSSYCDRGVTASGRYTAPGSAGGDYWLPLGSLVQVATYGTVLVDDRGQPGIADIDIWSPSCAWSFQWGRRYVRITVLRWGW